MFRDTKRFMFRDTKRFRTSSFFWSLNFSYFKPSILLNMNPPLFCPLCYPKQNLRFPIANFQSCKITKVLPSAVDNCFFPHHWKLNFAKNASFHEALMDLLVQISGFKVDGPRQQYDIFLHSSFHGVLTRGFF